MFSKQIFLIFFSIWALAVVAAPVPPLPPASNPASKPLPPKLFRLGNTQVAVTKIRAADFGNLVNGKFAPSTGNLPKGLSTSDALAGARAAAGTSVAKNVWTISPEDVQKNGFLVTADGGLGGRPPGHVTISLTTPLSENDLLLKLQQMPWRKLSPQELGIPPAPKKANTLPPPKAGPSKPKKAGSLPLPGKAAQAPPAGVSPVAPAPPAGASPAAPALPAGASPAAPAPPAGASPVAPAPPAGASPAAPAPPAGASPAAPALPAGASPVASPVTPAPPAGASPVAAAPAKAAPAKASPAKASPVAAAHAKAAPAKAARQVLRGIN